MKGSYGQGAWKVTKFLTYYRAQAAWESSSCTGLPYEAYSMKFLGRKSIFRERA